MASTSPKTPCITCGKGIGLFKCEGCIQTFCTKHVLEHRQTLHHQLDEIVIGHDILQQNIMENKDQKHPWMNFIDEWEQKSIEKIQQMAKETRQKLTDFVDIHRRKVSDELNLLSEQIKKAREEDDFFETDLNNWISTIDKLKQGLINIPLLNNIKEDQSTPLIYQLQLIPGSSNVQNKTTFKHHPIDSKMKNYEDIFENCLDGVTIEDNGRLIIHNKSNHPIEVRGKSEYSSGIHQFRLQIEKNPLETWIFFGIISKLTPMTKNSYESSSAYGWADYNDIFLAGIRQSSHPFRGQFSHTRENDIISLIFDCDKRKISYTNEQNQYNQELNIDLNKCPFPWQLHINLFGKDDQVRLLSAMSLS